MLPSTAFEDPYIFNKIKNGLGYVPKWNEGMIFKWIDIYVYEHTSCMCILVITENECPSKLGCAMSQCAHISTKKDIGESFFVKPRS